MLLFIRNGQRLPVTNMFDITGEETDDPDLAMQCVGRLPDGNWFATECWDGDIVEGELN